MKGSRFFAIFIALSLLLHAGLFLASGLPLGRFLQGLDPRTGKALSTQPAERQVLLDLKGEDDPGRDETRKFLANQDRRGLGRATEEKGINRLGQQDRGAAQQAPSPIPPNQAAPRPPQTTEPGEKVSRQKPQPTMQLTSPVAVWTGEGAALNLGEVAARFQVGSEAYVYADFFNQYFKAFFKALVPFLQANGLATYLMKQDAVSILTWVDREGAIGFERALTLSQVHPFLNHAAQGAAEYAGRVAPPPSALFPPSAKRVYIPLELGLSGQSGVVSLTVPKLLPTAKPEAP